LQLTATANPGYTFSSWSGDLTGSANPKWTAILAPMSVTATFTRRQSSSLDVALAAAGAGRVTTVGSNGSTQDGYAAVTWGSSSTAPYGTAIFSYSQNGVVVSEAGVPASPPTTSARIFVDYRTGASIPGSAGTVDTYTGFAAVNRGSGTANISYTLRKLSGDPIASGTGSLGVNAHMASFINQLPDVLSGFSIPPSFPTDTCFGTLELSSDQPLSIVALRLTTNQRGETLLTSTPIADMSHPFVTRD